MVVARESVRHCIASPRTVVEYPNMRKIIPVLLSGGAGTRLWPLSREAYPKQLLPLGGSESMLQASARRGIDPDLFLSLIVIANAEHRFLIAEQLRAVGVDNARIVLEPVARNTAPAVAVAALEAMRSDPEALILVMPADHVIGDPGAFQKAVQKGAAAATAGQLVLFGIKPTAPATGYGYIRRGEPLPGDTFKVESFAEKPDFESAQGYISSGEYYWNSGIFLLPARVYMNELRRFQPSIYEAAESALAGATEDLDFVRLAAEPFAHCPSISIDYAVMEKTELAAVVPVDFSWSDIGAWSALWDISAKDASGNVIHGDVMVEDATGCLVRSEGQLVAALGVANLIIVSTPDAILVTSKERDQDVKKVVERLKKTGREIATQAHRVHRPWGHYESIQRGDRFQVKLITVNPGGKLSLQKHFHRAEHWVVVNGTAQITRDGEEILLRENESVFLPLGCVHRLENPGKIPLNLIEVQSGAYLGEDDIVRFEDVYSRT